MVPLLILLTYFCNHHANGNIHFQIALGEHLQSPENRLEYTESLATSLGIQHAYTSSYHCIDRQEFILLEHQPEDFFNFRTEIEWDDVFHHSFSRDKPAFTTFDSQSKSQNNFFFTKDDNFLVKTMMETEFTFWSDSFADAYFEHMTTNPSSLLSKAMGVYTLFSITANAKVNDYLILVNVYKPCLDYYSTLPYIYDLKGATNRRYAPPGSFVLFDENFLEVNEVIYVPEKQLYIDQIAKDVDLLSSFEVMDYSLLVAGGYNDELMYCIGIIDYLQPYLLKQWLENVMNTITDSLHHLQSPVKEPIVYENRFLNFVIKHTKQA